MEDMLRAELIDELKREHSEIIDVLLRVKGLGVDTGHGREVLLSAKDKLLSHIKKEDDELYPALKKAAEGDGDLSARMEDLAAEMRLVSKKAFAFFEKYSEGGASKKAIGGIASLVGRLVPGKKAGGFVEDFDDLFSMVLSRIQKEENVLYTAYARLVGQ
jgi:hypothetical protein